MNFSLTKLFILLSLSFTLVSCEGMSEDEAWDLWIDVITATCADSYDAYGNYLGQVCYYSEGGTIRELDISGEVADKEAFILEKTAEIYAEKFSLSNDQAVKIAKNVIDFEALQDRSADDVADFAQKLYGVNPNEIASAIGKAQVGENAELDSIIEQASQNFNTSADHMKAIVKELHGKALEANGIEL